MRRQIEPRSRKVLRFQFNRAQQPSPVVAPLFFSPNVAQSILAVLAQAPRVSSRARPPKEGLPASGGQSDRRFRPCRKRPAVRLLLFLRGWELQLAPRRGFARLQGLHVTTRLHRLLSQAEALLRFSVIFGCKMTGFTGLQAARASVSSILNGERASCPCFLAA